MGQQEEAEKIKGDVSKTTSEHAGDLGGAMGGGCSPALATQASSTFAAVQNVASQITTALSGLGVGSLLGMDDSLKKIYDNAKTTNQQALYNEYVAEKNYVTNKYGSGLDLISKGTTEYNDLLVNRYKALGNNELVELNTKHVEINNLIMDFIKVIGEQNIAVTNMQKVMEDVVEDNKHLLNAINGGKSDLYTFNRKSMYESKLKESVENWTLIPGIIYWTLVILWVCIVMFYLKNVTLISVGILIGLILYPYFSTPVFLWVLEIIQSIWNFIFMAVHNRISA
uniref:Uncharacterized protein n=1 Tax=viral metagenome TaxID=1070528 RepID=A0A6C0EXD1_9ZZZZ